MWTARMRKDQGKCLRKQNSCDYETTWRHGAGSRKTSSYCEWCLHSKPLWVLHSQGHSSSCQPIASAPHPHHPGPGRGLQWVGYTARILCPEEGPIVWLWAARARASLPQLAWKGRERIKADMSECRRDKKGWWGLSRKNMRSTRRRSPGLQTG